MRRFCIHVVIVGSLLVASAPAQADAASSHRQQARGGAAHTLTKAAPGKRTSSGTRSQKFTYGRT